MQRERLSVALRDEADAFVAVFPEEVLEREVGELESQFSDDAGLSPSSGEFYLVAAFGYEGIGDVDGSRLLVRMDVFGDFLSQDFGVELVHVRELSYGTLDALHGEEVAGLGAELASDDVVEYAFVAGNADAVEGSLLPFGDAHFEVDAVALDVDFHGVEVIEHVAVVVVLLADGIFIL